MRLRLRVAVGDTYDDVVIDADPMSTVAELVAALVAQVAPTHCPEAGLGLRVEDVAGVGRTLPPAVRIGEAGIRSGATVRPASTAVAAPDPMPAATLMVHSGPGAPMRVELCAGRHNIGRAGDCDVLLPDLLVSAHHARLLVDERVEIVDHDSNNGVLVDGERVARAVLEPSTRCVLGNTVLSVRLRPASRVAASGVEVFNRSPRVEGRFDGLQLAAPEPPRPPTPIRFPLATVLAPIGLSAVLFAFTQSVLSVLFFALSPILMLGTWWETRSTNRRQRAADTARFRTALADLEAQIDYAHDLERSGRRSESPGVVQVVEAVDEMSSLVWTRRPEHDGFGRISLGLATQPSRTTVEVAPANDAALELWAELRRTVERAAEVDGVPVVADLRESGNIGVAGLESASGPVLRGVLVQLLGLHSPSELRLAAVAPAGAWDWLKWAPHVDPNWLAGTVGEAGSLIGELETIVAERSTRSEVVAELPMIVVAVHEGGPGDRSALVRLAEAGPEVGVHMIWFAPHSERLPAACRVFVDVDSVSGRGTVGNVNQHRVVARVRLEPAGVAAGERMSRLLSPYVDHSSSTAMTSGAEADVALVDLLGDDVACRPAAIVERWRRSEEAIADGLAGTGLRAVVGDGRGGPMEIDLRSQGPHAIVGGTTGSGKSEFLQTWILSLAANYGPSDVTFLLVDYKGGAAFAECVDLPHCVGLVTDLRPRLVRRALRSLEAEIRRREHLLHDRRAKDISDLEARQDPGAPPNLVIVVDEFAALAAEVPEFVDGVINLAQRGRSLGLHLILATQRPGGVVTDNIRANVNLRIALRMADATDSVDVVGAPIAAELDPRRPGSAVAVVGAGQPTQFQSAYVGGRAAGGDRRVPITVRSLRCGGHISSVDHRGVPAQMSGPSDLVRIVGVVRAAAALERCATPLRPWLPELADRYRLEELPTARRDDQLVFGVSDDPDDQSQPLATFNPDVDGNMAVYGTGGAGKTTALRTVALSAGFGTVRGGDVWVYAIDAAGGGLSRLGQLPHVGAVVSVDDDERVVRLLRFVSTQLDARSARFAVVGATTVGEFRQRTGEREARIVLIVDGLGAFRDAYEGGRRHDRWERFARIATDGRSVGIHVVMAADRPAAVPSSLAASVQRNLVLRVARELDGGTIGRGDPVDADAPPGRGTFNGRETHVAVLGGHLDAASQARSIDSCATMISALGILPPPPIGVLPTRIALGALPPVVNRAMIGLDDETLEPVGVEPNGGFLIAGGPGSGVTSAVATFVQAIRRVQPDTDLVLLDPCWSPLVNFDGWSNTAAGADEIAVVADRISRQLHDATQGPTVLVVDAIDQLLDTAAEFPVQELLRVARRRGMFVLVAGETTRLAGSWQLLQAARSYRSGIVLQPDQIDGEALFNVPFPPTHRGEFPAGRGFVVRHGSVTKVQLAAPE